MTTALDKQIGLRIAAHRRALGWSQSHLANRAGVSYQQISKYELGTNRVSAACAAQIAELLGVPLAAILGGNAPALPKNISGELELIRLFRAMDPKRQKATRIIVRAVAG